jgi:hypothetical protein
MTDLEDEKKTLIEEKEQLQQTIDLLMKELQKLHIGAGNTVEPRLDEGPLEFANRMWEKVKPRDTGVVISEHVGEIKKPVADGDNSPQQPGEKVRQVVDNVASAIAPVAGSIWERGRGAWSNIQSNIQQKLQERQNAQQAAEAPKKQSRKGKGRGKKEEEASVDAQPPSSNPTAEAATEAQKPTVVNVPADVPVVPEIIAEATTSTKTPAPAPEPVVDEASQEQISSTILIEAELTLDDGSVQTIQVRAADRCKEVASRFIQEHSLKAWFTDPLTKWLKQVEADAVKFPVKVSGDLMEIRKQHSKSN